MIKKIHACNKMNFSSNINEVIRAVLNFLFFLKKISHTQKRTEKHQKHKKTHKNATKQKQKSNLFALCFLCTRRKENRKNEKSLQCNLVDTNVAINYFRKS